jgi:hypothetical protein
MDLQHQQEAMRRSPTLMLAFHTSKKDAPTQHPHSRAWALSPTFLCMGMLSKGHSTAGDVQLRKLAVSKNILFVKNLAQC